MKKKLIFITFFLLLIVKGKAQVTQQKIGTNPTTINSSAVVELESTTKGFLPPRMTKAQMRAIASPVEGLMVYETDSKCLRTYSNGAWTGCYGYNPGFAIDMTKVTWSSNITPNSSYTGTVTIPYTNGDGQFFNGLTTTSSGVTTALTCVINATTLNLQDGNLVANITGTLGSAQGNGTFLLNILGTPYSLPYKVNIIPFGLSKLLATSDCGALTAPVDGTGAPVSTITSQMLGSYYKWKTASPLAAGNITTFSPYTASTTLWTGTSWTNNTPCAVGYRLPKYSEMSTFVNNATFSYIGSWPNVVGNWNGAVVATDKAGNGYAVFPLTGNLGPSYFNSQGQTTNYWLEDSDLTSSGTGSNYQYFYVSVYGGTSSPSSVNGNVGKTNPLPYDVGMQIRCIQN